MELRQYWRIVRDRWLVVAGVTTLALIAAIVSVVTLPQPVSSYQATVRISARPQNVPAFSYSQYGEYYLFIASEYLNDDIINVVESDGFLDALRARYASRPEGTPNGSIKGKKAHRVMAFTVSSDRGADAMTLAQGISELLTAPGPNDPKYIPMITEQDPKIAIVDPPRLIVQSSGVRRGAFDVAVRTLLGLVVGVALTFLLNYLDDTLRDSREAARLTGLPVLAEIPAGGRERLRVKAPA